MMIVRALVGGLDLQFIQPASKPHIDRFDKMIFAAMTPMQVVNVLNDENGIQSINKIEKLIIGGSGMPFGLEEKLQTVTSEIWQTYGMTETITHIALRKVNGAGKTEWYNSLQGVSINSDERNCLILDYLKIGIENLLTNDVVEFNKTGGFKIIGRIDNVVNSGGVKLFPEQIEKKLEGIIDGEFYITGIPDETLGERLTLIVEGDKMNEAEYVAFFNEIKTNLAGFEVPKEIIFQTTIKRTLSGKLIRDF
jgi:O-succinylbenzoic acid--CoA ligase